MSAEKENLKYDFGGKRILMAEDTIFNAEIIKELLRMVNINADHAKNGEEAVHMFEETEAETYGAILMDIQMPVMDGYAATEKIRASEHKDAKRIPIFAMTASSNAEDLKKAKSAGMDGYIGKPIDADMLYWKLSAVL